MDDADTESYRERKNQWDQQWPTSGAESRDQHSPEETDITDIETSFPGVVGTTDSLQAVRDAEPYMPALDPPVLPGEHGGIEVATGFGMSAEEEADSGTNLRGDEDVHDEIMLTLRRDSLTTPYDWSVTVVQGVVRLRGAVSSLDDAEYAMSVIGELPGVVDVVDNTTLDTSLG